jgi:cytochrome P450
VTLGFSIDSVNHDPELYSNSDKFDGYRFLRLRETDDSNKYTFTHSSKTSLGFGAGPHACPGRFYAAVVAKLTIAAMLSNYEIKFADENNNGGQAKNICFNFHLIPDPTAKIILRRRSKEELGSHRG